MNEDILSLLESLMPTFSKGQKRIAIYIQENYDKAAFMTAGKLGKAVGISESTVVRFAVELGYDGYPSMQKAMREMVLNRLTSVQRIGVAQERLAHHDIVSMVLQSDAEKLRQTNETLDRESFQSAVEAIKKAKHIYVIGVRSAASMANFTGYYLSYMFPDVHIITASGSGEMFEKLINIEAQDTVIAFSFPRYSASTVQGVRYCRSVGATVIGITNSNLSPLAQNSDFVLLAKSDMLSVVDSLVAPLSIINALIVALASDSQSSLAKNFDKLEHIWEEYHVYEKQADTP